MAETLTTNACPHSFAPRTNNGFSIRFRMKGAKVLTENTSSNSGVLVTKIKRGTTERERERESERARERESEREREKERERAEKSEET